MTTIAMGGIAGAQQPVHEVCRACHTETVSDFLEHPHSKAGFSCDTCHGASIEHRESSGAAEPDRIAAPDQVPELCGGCHNQPVSDAPDAATLLSEYRSSKHGVFVAERSKVRAPHCSTCHGAHRIRAARAIEMTCQRCHREIPQACSADPPSDGGVQSAGRSPAPPSRSPAPGAFQVRCAGCHRPHLFHPPR